MHGVVNAQYTLDSLMLARLKRPRLSRTVAGRARLGEEYDSGLEPAS